MERGKAVAVESTSVSTSTPIPQLLCLSLHETDKIRVMNLSPTSIPAIRACIQSSWPHGIQSEGIYGISYQFKLRGRPWEGHGEQAVLARRLVAAMFGMLLRAGWELRLSSDLSKWNWDKDTFYFKPQLDLASRVDPRVQVCAISFNRGDTIRVIDGPPELVQLVRSCIHSFWHRGLQREFLYYGVPEFKLLGNPWMAGGTETMQTRMFVGQMIEVLERGGWEVYASIDISVGKNRSSDSQVTDLDSWILRSKLPTSTSATIGVPALLQKPTVKLV